MLESLHIRNFRIFGEIEISRLGRINLFTGRNNSGKTTLLEALFLLSGAGAPQMALNTNVIRGMEPAAGFPAPQSPEAVWETLWKPFFSEFDMEKHIEISAFHASSGTLSLKVAPERTEVMELPLGNGAGETSVARLPGERSLVLSFSDRSAKEAESRLKVTGQGIRIEQSDARVPFPAVFLSSRIGNLHEDAMRLGQLRKRKQGDLLLKALQVIEPRLRSVEDNSASGAPMIWGDVGFPELAPLAAMGEGMTRIARLVLAISSAPGGIVLVDEIENGLHHSVQSRIWEVVDEAARQLDAQVFATTHSFECLEAAHRSLDGGAILLHRLETDGSGCRCTTYEPEETDAAIHHDLEVR